MSSAGPHASHGASHSAAESRDELRRLLEPVVTAAGYDLEDVAVTQAGRRRLVRVSVDADHGIDLDAVAEVSRLVSDAIDTAEQESRGGEAFAGPYVLEVSSPGVDRPLTEPRHWRRAVGRLVEVPVGGAPVVGRVTAADATGVRIEINGIQRELGYAELGKGRVQVEFNRATDDTTDDEDS
jgi:ribosome maturation factor RimP